MAEPSNNQMAFWEAMKEKYERRNESLKQQEACLKKRLEQLRIIMEQQKVGDDCDCVPEKLEKPSLVQCLVQKGKNLILGGCKCVDPKVGENLLCACHIEDPNTPINVDPNICANQGSSESCSNPACNNMAENPSTFSLKTTDVYYMDKLADLVKSEKNMQEKIEDLEKREHSYLTAIRELRESMKKQPKTDPMNKEFKKMVEALEEENQNLRNELKDLRLELKHCFERVEGPLKRSLQVQQEKCINLENQLKDLQAKSKSKEDSYVKEIIEMKAKLCKACCTMVDLNSVNSKLKEDLKNLQDKCANLEDELLKQQMKEAENILKFKSMLSRRCDRFKVQAKGDESGQELAEIAKKLGDTLKEVCPCVPGVPSGLTETAENIRQLTQLVVEKGAQQRKKKKKKTQQVPTRSCACGSDTINQKKPVTPPKPKEADKCGCSNSSLRLKPQTGRSTFSDKQIGDSSSATLASIPTMKMGVPKYTSTPKSNLKKTASKSCTCCPAVKNCDNLHDQQQSIDTLGRCSDLGNKKTGPSEEVIAVKNLGTLSIPHEVVAPPTHDANFTKSRREKLAVDTTVDVLDVPPKDIHIVTTIAKTGSLEITTEGPPGVVQTKVNYLQDGKIEIVTKLIDRNNMDDFFDGTLLQIPEGPPDCQESQTCGGECDLQVLPACPETDCDNSQTCGGTCSEGTDGPKDNDQTYGRVVMNNFALFEVERNNPFLSNEWKNTNFHTDIMEEISSESMNLVKKFRSKPKERIAIHEDVESGNDFLKLSSRLSLTDVENHQKDQKQIIFSSTYKDVLDTISEADEQIDTSTNESKDLSFEAEKEEKFDVLEEVIDSPNLFDTGADRIIGDNGIEREFISVLTSTSSREILSLKSKLDFDAGRDLALVSSSTTCEEISSALSKSDSDKNEDSPDASENILSVKVVSEVPADYQITESFYKFSGNFNLANAKVTLRQSKSMYEKSGKVSEYLRICKSASLSLGSLQVDLERLKLSSRHPTVGDFELARWDNRNWISMDDLKLVTLSSNVTNGISCLRKNLKISGALEEGCNSLGTLEPFAKHDYQCYVCCCSKKTENQQATSNRDQINNSNLEQRIDRLLEIDPLSPGHGVNCHCEHCQDKGKEKFKNKQYKQGCNCKRKKQNESAEMARKGKDTAGNQKDTLLHDENCTCVDCICSPCNFKKSKTNISSSKTRETPMMQSNFSCDCGEICKCDPCMSEGGKMKQKRKPPCKRCSSKDSLTPESTVPALPDTWKNVVGGGCHCNKTGCKSCHHKVETTSVGSKTADANGDDLIGGNHLKDITKVNSEPPVLEPKEEQKTCACLPECLCNLCPLKTVAEELPKADTGIRDSRACSCLPDKARNNRDSKMREIEKNTVPDRTDPHHFLNICDCLPECSCNPCALLEGKKEVAEELPKADTGIRDSRTCSCVAKNNRDSEMREVELHKTVIQKNAVSDMSDPPYFLNICDCLPECSCNPCALLEGKKLNKKVEKESVDPDNSHLDSKSRSCLCLPKCSCDPCPEKNLRRRIKEERLRLERDNIESEMKNTEIDLMIEMSDLKYPKNICDCLPECLCSSCPMPGGKGLQKKVEKENSVSQENSANSEPKSCVCRPKCSCSPCSRRALQVGDSDKSKCDCQKCECEICFKSHSLAAEVIESVQRKTDEHKEDYVKRNFTKKVTCDCGTCECESCMEKRDETPKEGKVKGYSLEAKNDKEENTQTCGSYACVPYAESSIKIGDADRAREELMNVLNRIGSTCDQAEVNLKPLVKRASNFESTVSHMKLKLNNLQQKCNDKDQIINAMTKELRMRSQSGVFADLLHDLSHPKQGSIPDFTRTYICDALPKPKHSVCGKLQPKRCSLTRFGNKLEPILELDRYLPGTREVCPCPRYISGFEIIDIRRVTLDSILMKWKGPACLNGITGYQIFVNDKLKYRVLSPNRTSAVIDSLDLSSSLEVMLYAITPYGRCEPPALATYKI